MVEQALGNSRFFVLLASPEAARSKWVRREVEFWFAAKDPRNLLIALIDGDIWWDEGDNDFDWTRTTALPEAFTGRYTGGEPLWVDLRAHTYAKPSLDDPNFQDAVAALAATVHGKSKSDLVGEELRQQRKFARIRNAVAAGLAVLLVLAIVAGIGFLGQRNTARSQRDLAVSRQLMTESTAVLSADPRVGRLLAAAAARIAPESERNRADATLRAAIMDPGRYVLREQGQLSTVPAVANGQIATARMDGSIRIWNADTGQPTATLDGHAEDVVRMVFSADGSKLVSGSADQTVRVWDLASKRTAHVIRPHDGAIYQLAFDATGDLIATVGDRSLDVWSSDTGERIWGVPAGVGTMGFSADGAMLAVGGYDSGLIQLRNSRTGGLIRELVGLRPGTTKGLFFGQADAVLMSSDSDGTERQVAVWSTDTGKEIRPRIRFAEGQWITPPAIGHRAPISVTGEPNGRGRIWDTTGARAPIELTGHTEQIFSVAISPDDATVATAGGDGTVRVWDASTGMPIAVLTGYAQRVTYVAFDRDGAHLVSAGEDGEVRLWNIIRPHRSVVPGEPGPGAAELSLNADGSVAATGGDDIRLWRTDGELVRKLLTSTDGGAVWADVFSPDGSVLAASETDVVLLLDTSTGQVRREIRTTKSGSLSALAFSPDGGTLAVDELYAVGLWDVVTGEKRAEFRTQGTTAVEFNPRGDLIALRLAGETVDIVDWRSKRTVIQLPDIDLSETVFAFSNDGQRLASSGGRTLHLWQTSTGEKADLRGHAGQILAAAFSPGDATIATAGEDRTIRIWDVATGTPIAVLQGGHNDTIRVLRFRADGTLVSVASDRAISLWDISMLSGDLIDTACGQAGSGFTDDERNEFLSGYGEIEAC
jgi:WD40 repeat protein